MGSAFCCSLRVLIAVDLIRSMDSRAVVRRSFSDGKPLSCPTPKLLGEWWSRPVKSLPACRTTTWRRLGRTRTMSTL